MNNRDKMHLYFDTHLNGYCVLVEQGNADVSYTMGIIRGWDDNEQPEYVFKRICHMDGEWHQVVTGEEMAQRLNDIHDHEGEDVADIWCNEQQNYLIGTKSELEMFEKAGVRFLAFVELGLSLPMVHEAQFVNPRPDLTKEADEKVLEARKREDQRQSEMMHDFDN